jgi:hypothetical protein
MHMHIMHFGHIHPSITLAFYPPLLTGTLLQTNIASFMFMSYIYMSFGYMKIIW